MAQVEQIGQFNSAKGPVAVQEISGNAYFLFSRGGSFNLPRDWRQSTIEKVVTLNSGSTAVVVAYARGECGARQSLIVIDPNKIWGPYDLGGCEDSLAYQVSSDRNAFVAIRATERPAQAWVYTADDHLFRGPAAIKLPASLARLMANPAAAPFAQPLPSDQPITEQPPEPVPKPKGPTARKPAISHVKRESPALDVKASAAAPMPNVTSPLPKALVEVPVASSRSAYGIAVQSPPVTDLKVLMPAPKVGKKTAISPDDASAISNQVKKSTRAQPQVTIDLSL